MQEEIRAVLKTVDDPELPNVSVADLGMVHEVTVVGGDVFITMVPTFAGCPALDFIQKNVKTAVEEVDWVKGCEVQFSFEEKWSTDAITDEGKSQLKKHGIAPPPENYRPGEEWTVDCPYCGSDYTSMENVFGPTACRSILYCTSCRNPFEAMKPVVDYVIN
ncbi:phenylacetate-CoA oxygenase subunit PaaJ [Filobacillus milosensis]|uniref:Phenylacetate-CoA oxygenase subunit PaaJ n=1 Tax=Filobacillus milosensis TaxID=94137 RepID=A0A4Y8IG34_9BACI|nr:1,2-phenylacetyl-CoA epoxidase subunit PaaD [Filobacillus milosensis]TFB19639.1 phenylacetate-CoA oxygenase subunit PaaJ [Filobacillus milosensis]